MNLKFAVIPLGICLFGSALSMDYKNAQNVEYSEPQKAAITNFVNEVGCAWTLEVKRTNNEIDPEPRRDRSILLSELGREMSVHPAQYSQAGFVYYSSLRDFRNHPSECTYKRCLKAQLKMGVLDLESLEAVSRPGYRWGTFGRRVFVPTPNKMLELLPDLIETLGLTVYSKV
ncbi:MAG: hypothetical protein LBJ71_01845 [Holosporaceae bacterium]|jgi:hypothetical protein|nr:hypothetical protein [Holosporaceae bacterium]